ncbi:DUF6506 family protein [Enterococcus cecorum]|uniref:DUF6506 family protein n=1 Tax=Enterococcus cecorum TaxID=44008 RepID=UPI001FAE429A|nr:DUF6506 family protein [Enterococcus cecorum]MCJ0587464.1 DUF6506 family protein [Enterococcus cecorum]MCJ0592271.1 DUF6506 family protein [Enterococcus cecorum]
MKLNAAFIFLAPNADYKKNRSVVQTEAVDLTTVGAKDYADAILAAKDLVANGVNTIELCGGFGIEGIAQVKKAVGPEVAIGVVRFDNHPGLEFKSGDELF